ncbi:dTDP-4-dehydrorhamnose reductase [Photobacterium sp.]|uniref:dTDP-4-dehydrorhamnose reductase n=1 Tax=Photobacterium sp. TaxID=660 RepID=UPI00299E25DF|nr:dTDP-4-dehydrorhamnose reductase [Photobacterium sp.]MDX1303671.1 dTDP-4-dehydrorhamnose reductase [Photobacterium sp.]
MKVLITGSLGQVGQSLVQQLNGKANLLAVDRSELDITDELAVNATVLAFSPDVIINAAAHTAVDRAEEEVELSYKINRDGPSYLAQAANKVGAAILHISTDYVFAGNREGLYCEEDATNPQSVYGQSKLAGEEAVTKHCCRHIILRTSWVFGEHGNNFVKTMLRLGQERDTLGIVGDQLGGPTYACDIADALIVIAEKICQGDTVRWGVYHYSGLPNVSWYEFAIKIFEQAKGKSVVANVPLLSSISTSQYPTPAKRPENSKLNTQKITNEFGIPASDWQKALQNIHLYA